MMGKEMIEKMPRDVRNKFLEKNEKAFEVWQAHAQGKDVRAQDEKAVKRAKLCKEQNFYGDPLGDE